MANLVPFSNRPSQTILFETFTGMFSNGWTDLAPGGDWWGANGAWAIFGFGTNVPEARARKTLSGFEPFTFNVIRVNMSWTNASAGDPDVYRFGAWINGVFQTLPAPGWLGGTSADIIFVAQADGNGNIDAMVGGTNFLGSINVIGAFNSIEGASLSSEFADIILDSAVLIVNGIQLTTSRGSWAFDPGEEWQDVSFPGRTMNTKGCRRLVRLKPTIRGNAMLTGEVQINAYRPGGQWSDHPTIVGARTFTPKALRSFLTSNDYLKNVFIVWKRLRNDYFAVEFPVAISNAYGLGSIDGDEGLFPLVIEAVQDLSTGTTKTAVPYRLHTLPQTTQTSDLGSYSSDS